MRLALLCDDPAVAPWLDAMAGDSAHELVLAAIASPHVNDLLRGRSGVRLTTQWEDLLVARDVDAILVGGGEPQLLEAIKQLATSGQPILFLPQADQGSTFLYELGLIRDDNRVILCPALWQRRDKALLRLREVVRHGLLGKVQLLQMERELAGSSSTGPLPQKSIDAELLLDLDLLRWLSGDYDQVTAMRTGASGDGLLMQTVTLAGRQLPEATWHAKPSAGEAVRRLTVHAEQGRAVLELDPVSNEWALVEPDGTKVVGNRVAAARELLDEFAASVARETSPVEWPELVKAFETLDATHRSVARRRTIELHFEPMSERAIFKTQMTAMGCGVLIATFLLTLLYLAIASTVPLPKPVLLVLRTLVFAPIAIFLGLQVLFPLARPTSSETRPNGGESAAP